MDSDTISALLASLSEAEQAEFVTLLEHLKTVGGDIEKLSDEDKSKLQSLAARHNSDNQNDVENVQAEPESLTATPSKEAVYHEAESAKGEVPDSSPTQTLFGQYVISQVRTLCEGGSSLSDAIRYAYHNKYLPVSLREEVVCKDVLQRYQSDILDLAHSFRSLESAHLADAKLLVGFAWFAVIYDCYQYIEAYGELE